MSSGLEGSATARLASSKAVASPLGAWGHLEAGFEESQAGGAAGVAMALLTVILELPPAPCLGSVTHRAESWTVSIPQTLSPSLVSEVNPRPRSQNSLLDHVNLLMAGTWLWKSKLLRTDGIPIPQGTTVP